MYKRQVEGWQGTVDNDYIKEDFGLSGMLKMGAEVKITPQFAIRAGGAWQHSPAKSTLLYDEKGDGVMAVSYTHLPIPYFGFVKSSAIVRAFEKQQPEQHRQWQQPLLSVTKPE